jgi:hypothetical protein
MLKEKLRSNLHVEGLAASVDMLFKMWFEYGEKATSIFSKDSRATTAFYQILLNGNQV